MSVFRLKNWTCFAVICIITGFFYADSSAQWDASPTRYLTRSKLWATYRMTGLQGQQAIGSSQTNDQAGLSYPGSSIRAGEFVEFMIFSFCYSLFQNP